MKIIATNDGRVMEVDDRHVLDEVFRYLAPKSSSRRIHLTIEALGDGERLFTLQPEHRHIWVRVYPAGHSAPPTQGSGSC